MTRLFALVFTLASFATPAQAATVTLEALVTRVAHAPNVEAAEEAAAAAHAQLRQAQLLWVPTGDATLTLTGAPDVHCDTRVQCLATSITDLASSKDGVGLDGRAPFNHLLLNFTAQLIQPLYTFGKIEMAQALAENGVAAAQANLRRDRADLVVVATRAYYGRKTARLAVAILEEAIAEMSRWLGHMQSALDGDNKIGYTEADVSRLKLTLVNLRQQLVDQKRAAAATRAAVAALVDDSEGDVDDDALELPSLPLGTLDDWQARAEKRPEFRLIRAGLQASRHYRLLNLTQALPDLGIFSALVDGVNTLGPLDRPPNGYIPQPAGALGGAFALVFREHIDLAHAVGNWSQGGHEDLQHRAQALQAVGGMNIEVAKSYSDAVEAQQRAQATARAEATARGWLAAVDEDMAIGLFRDARELLDCFNNWTQFRLRHAQAVGDAQVAFVALRRATDLDGDDAQALVDAVTGRR